MSAATRRWLRSVEGPAAELARRTQARDPLSRAYPAVAGDLSAERIVLAATRALLAVQSREEAAAVVQTAVRDLGGEVIPARLASHHVVPVDVSLGSGDPLVVRVEPATAPAMFLAACLPALMEDALRIARRCDENARSVAQARLDPLTGVASRAETTQRLAALLPGDTVVLVDLDRFKEVNDTYGHAAGDETLRALGSLLRGAVRPHDLCGRYGGDEFVICFEAMPVEVAVTRVQTLARQWRAARQGSTLSAGVASVGARGGAAALAAADTALYRAKRAGRDRTEVAVLSDYPDSDDPTAGP